MQKYELYNGGWVQFNWKNDVQSVRPWYENTVVTLNNGKQYALRGRSYGV